MGNPVSIQLGEIFGSLTVIGEPFSTVTPGGSSKRRIPVRCSCGSKFTPQLNNIRSGNTLSCGKCDAANDGRRAASLARRKESYGPAFAGLFSAYKRKAEKRKLSFTLTREEFFTLTQRECNYCGAPPSNVHRYVFADGPKRGQLRSGEPYYYSGIDRVNSDRGYDADNTVPCCIDCNRSKADRSLEYFESWLERAYQTMRSTR